MATIKDAIANYIIGLLDANTLGEEFQVAIDIKSEKDRFRYFSLPDRLNKEIVTYTPASLGFEDTPANIPIIDKTTWRINLEFGLTGLDDLSVNFQNQKAAIEELRLAIVNNPRFTVTANNQTYEVRMVASSLTRSGAIQPKNNLKRVLQSMAIAAISGVGIKFGDDETFELRERGTADAFVSLNATRKVSSNPIEYSPGQYNGQDSAKSIPNAVAWTSKVMFTYDSNNPIHVSLYDFVMDNTDFEKEWELRITKITGNQIIKFVSAQLSNSAIKGVDTQLDITLTEVE